jgi:hypothetical protein
MTDVDLEIPPADRPAGPTSILARIKADRDARSTSEHVDLPIPTWNGDLVARYVVIERRAVEKLADPKLAGTADLDFLIRACHGVFMRDDNGDMIALADDAGPVRFDARLAMLLGIEATTGRDVVQYLFRANALAIGAHAAKVADWMQDTSQVIDGAILGN